jgi:hypothetical protein
MERMIVLPGGAVALDNALAGDRHYDGMQAPDGSDISTRSKHREFMKRTGLTTTDDFKGEWATAQKQREERRQGIHEDRGLRQHLEREFQRRIS